MDALDLAAAVVQPTDDRALTDSASPQIGVETGVKGAKSGPATRDSDEKAA
jgi:hypothetical protein